MKLLPVSSAPATVDAAATPKKQRPVLLCRHSEDDLKSGDYEYITEDSKSSVVFNCAAVIAVFLSIVTYDMLPAD